jgi:hypothetical protein
MNLHPFSSLVQPGETPIPTEPLPPNPAPPPAPPPPPAPRPAAPDVARPPKVFPRPALSSTQLTFGIRFVFPTRMIPKIGITTFSGKSSIIIEGKYEKSLTKPLEEAGLAVREVIACDRRILGFHWLDKDRIK